MKMPEAVDMSAYRQQMGTRLPGKPTPLKDDGGDGTLPPMTDDWKVGVDTQLAQLHQDVRNLLYGVIGSFLILAAGGWAVYGKLGDQTNALQVEVAKQAERQEAIRDRLGSVDRKLDSVEAKLDRLLEKK